MPGSGLDQHTVSAVARFDSTAILNPHRRKMLAPGMEQCCRLMKTNPMENTTVFRMSEPLAPSVANSPVTVVLFSGESASKR